MRRRAFLLGLGLLAGCAMVDNAVDRTEMQVDGARLYLSGLITSRTPARFEALVAAHPQVRTIVPLDLPGSLDSDASHRIGAFIRAQGLDTHLVSRSRVHSGGVSVFIAGNRRTADPGAEIGVHSWADGFGEGSGYPADAAEHIDNRDYVAAMLGSEAFYWFTLRAAPSDEIHVMSRSEIARYGLVTE